MVKGVDRSCDGVAMGDRTLPMIACHMGGVVPPMLRASGGVYAYITHVWPQNKNL